MLGNYWDWQLIHFLKYGFPLGFEANCRGKIQNPEDNHSSGTQFPNDVQKYLDTEIQHGAIMGPYDRPPYGEDTHCSPFMSREKADSDTRRIIIYLSWPHDASVNDFTPPNRYLGTHFKLQYPTVDSITNHLKSLGKGALIYKVDLSRAFRQLPIDPFDYDLLCLKWNGQYYTDLYCAFGTKAGSMLCSRLTDSFRYLATKQGHVTLRT